MYDFFLDYSWPGNIKGSWKIFLERAIITSDTNVITVDYIKSLLNKRKCKNLLEEGLKRSIK